MQKNKSQLRRHYRIVRESFSRNQVRLESSALCQRLADWNMLRRARIVLAYIAFRNELDLATLYDLVPSIRWIVPRVAGKRLICHPYDPGRLIRHRFGMLEPASDLPVVAPADIDLVLVPGVAFDRQGGRVGFGGGFYDRFLPTTPALRVGVTSDRCLADALPVDAHDQRVDWVVTPTHIYDCKKEGQ
jgi:5-formyltetrahydrofolate cyclo-ligase